jgi:RNA polymerase sigma-B factor
MATSALDFDHTPARRTPADGLSLVPTHGDAAGDQSRFEALVREAMPMAYRVAAGFAGRGQSLDDLRQVALLGLVKAARRYDEERGVLFSTYARAVMVGEVKRYFRDTGWGMHVPRPVQEVYLAVRKARETLTTDLQRPPTVAEVAALIGASEEAVIEALGAGETFYLESLDVPDDPDVPTARREPAVVDMGFLAAEERSWLIPALASLPERERHIIGLRFFEGLSQSEIAERIGISQMHVSRLLSRTLRQLRDYSEQPPAR